MGFGKESPIPKSREDCPAAKIMTCMPPLSTKVAALRQLVVRAAIFLTFATMFVWSDRVNASTGAAARG
jgi:hypothetical protein